MAIDLPIGTRLIVCGKTLDVAEVIGCDSCVDCAVRQHSADDVFQSDVVLGGDYSLNSGVCQFLQCLALRRKDGRAVHWKLINE